MIKIGLDEAVILQNGAQAVADNGEFLHTAQFFRPAACLTVQGGNQALERLVKPVAED
ncbi:hypothetical protein D3C76_905800 [compost metagenome]